MHANDANDAREQNHNDEKRFRITPVLLNREIYTPTKKEQRIVNIKKFSYSSETIWKD